MSSGDTTIDGDENGSPDADPGALVPSPPTPQTPRISDRPGASPNLATIVSNGPGPSQWGVLAVLSIGGLILTTMLIVLLLRSPLFGDSGGDATADTDSSANPVTDATATSTESDSGQEVGIAPAAPGAPSREAVATESLRCPVLTDSIDRLYLAFYARQPSEAEFARSVTQYRRGEHHLEGIAEELALAEDFQGLDDAAFVDQIYENTRGTRRAESREVWITALTAGQQTRGAFVVAISESQDFVEATRTTTPLSGFLRTYPAGTHWYCGIGPRDDLPIKPLDQATVYADHMFHNAGTEAVDVGIETLLGSQPHLTISEGALPGGGTSYRWNGLFNGDGGYGTALDIHAGQDTWWAVAFYPESIGEGRLGWQLNS